MKETQGEDETEGKIAKKTHHPGETMDGHNMELFKLSTIKSQ